MTEMAFSEEATLATPWNISPAAIQYESPLLICLSMLAGMFGRPVSTDALRAGLPAGSQFRPELVERAAERAGLHASLVYKPRLSAILPHLLPCIVLLKDRNAAILCEIDGESATLALPEAGGAPHVLPRSQLQELYAGYAVFARPQARLDNRSTDLAARDDRGWFWGTLWRFAPIYAHVLIASLLINVLAIASPLFTMNVYDRVVPNNAVETMWVLSLGVTIAFLFDFVLRNLRSYFVDTAGKNADVIIASRLLQQVMAMRTDHRPASTGSLANNLREFESLRDFFSSGTLVALVDLPFILVFVFILWIVGGPLALVPLAAIPVVLLVGWGLQHPLRRFVERTYRESSQKHALLVEVLHGLDAIRINGAEGHVQRNWEGLVDLTAASSGKAKVVANLSITFAALASQLVTVIMVVWGVLLIAEGRMTTGALIACTILVGRAMAPLGTVASMLTRLAQSRMALRALDMLMRTPTERPADKVFVRCPAHPGQITFRNVSFAYPGAKTGALTGVSLKIAEGERVGVIGRIGSGKTTIGRLLTDLYQPTEGAVLVGDTDLRQIDPADLRRKIGYVSQDTHLFFGSVRDNITFGAPFIDEAAMLRAAEIAGVADFLRHHPLGYDLPVGERGTHLSGGQRQSIAVARALLLDPPVLVLDEPSSFMDNSSEANFKKRLEANLAGKTLVVITHRSALLGLVNRLVVTDGGRIVADGPKEEVLEALRRGQVRATVS